MRHNSTFTTILDPVAKICNPYAKFYFLMIAAAEILMIVHSLMDLHISGVFTFDKAAGLRDFLAQVAVVQTTM